jgi:hypothetical protein
MKNGTTAPLGAFARIEGLLAAITPDQFIKPTKKVESGEDVFATAPDDIKRIFTLMIRLVSERCDIEKKLEEVSAAGKKLILESGTLQARADLENPETALFNARAEANRITAELLQIGALLEIVQNVLWFEVRGQYPESTDKPTMSINNNWELAWSTEKEGDGHEEVLIVLFS